MNEEEAHFMCADGSIRLIWFFVCALDLYLEWKHRIVWTARCMFGRLHQYKEKEEESKRKKSNERTTVATAAAKKCAYAANVIN